MLFKTLEHLILNDALVSNNSIKFIYCGRFQPFHINHYNAYLDICSKFGSDNVWIATSDKTNDTDSPFTFNDKVEIITKNFPINKDRILKVKAPYNSQSYLDILNDGDSLVFCVGEKDSDRLSSKYYDIFNPSKLTKSYKEKLYVYIIPNKDFKFRNEIVSGTLVRNIFKSNNDQLKKDFYLALYGKIKPDILKLFNTKISLLKENIYVEGGAAGHMSHPYDNLDMTPKSYLEFINYLFTNGLEKSTVKLDGQNIMVTYKNGEARFARNAGHLKNFGEASLNVNQISEMFKNRGDLSDAFNFAAQSINAWFNKNSKLVSSIYNEGECFSSLEIIYPKTQNVIPYGLEMLVFHNILKYDKDGNVIEELDVRILKDMINELNNINSKIIQKFPINGPITPIIQNFNKDEYISKWSRKFTTLFSNLEWQFNESQSEWVLRKMIESIDMSNTNLTVDHIRDLCNRIIYNEPSYFNIPKFKKEFPDLKDELPYINNFLKIEGIKIYNKIMEPLINLILELGVDVLNLTHDILVTNRESATASLIKSVKDAISQIKSTGDEAALYKLDKQINRLNNINWDIIPMEGIVVKWGDKVLKLTGSFAPVNQILGMLTYTR
jgi:hypothetical protein